MGAAPQGKSKAPISIHVGKEAGAEVEEDEGDVNDVEHWNQNEVKVGILERHAPDITDLWPSNEVKWIANAFMRQTYGKVETAEHCTGMTNICFVRVSRREREITLNSCFTRTTLANLNSLPILAASRPRTKYRMTSRGTAPVDTKSMTGRGDSIDTARNRTRDTARVG